MDEDLRKSLEEQKILLKENIRLSRENHERIKKIHRSMQRSFYARIAYWGVVVLIAIGAFYAISPTLNRIVNQYQAVTQGIQQTNDYFKNPEQIFEQELGQFNFLQNLFGTSTEKEVQVQE